MAKYLERLQELLDNGKLSQEEYDELADLSAAKDAIKEFNQVKSERDSLAGKVQQFETAPKRKEALKRLGVDYDAQPKYGRKTLDAIPADKLDDLEFVADFLRDEGFEAKPAEKTDASPSDAQRIVDFATSSTGATAPPTVSEKDKAFYADLDAVPDGDREGVRQVLVKHGRAVADQG